MMEKFSAEMAKTNEKKNCGTIQKKIAHDLKIVRDLKK